ncbi:hypothetical protein GW17_00059204 [Ensete ventricosum]|nr:hypothetical protein GW17_00059204 [Ensete ventricosum]
MARTLAEAVGHSQATCKEAAGFGQGPPAREANDAYHRGSRPWAGQSQGVHNAPGPTDQVTVRGNATRPQGRPLKDRGDRPHARTVAAYVGAVTMVQ